MVCGERKTMSGEKALSIAIIGGTGEFGRLFARIFREEGHRVVITGRDRAKGQKVSKSVGAEYTHDNAAAAKEADIVIISVPIEKTVEVIEEVAPHVRSGGLLMDFTSVKVRPAKAMLESAPEDVEIIGTHPMFGPRVAGLEGQTVILTPLRGGRWLDFLEGFFTGRKARVYISTPEEHDRTMAVVQGLTHFAYITTASTIRRLDIDVDHSRRFASPVYELMLDFIARIVGQNPRLYAAIQMHNPYVEEVHRVFIEEAQRLKEAVSRGDVDGFIGIMAASARIFRDVDGSMGKSDKAISALTSELKNLKGSVGKEVALRHIYSGKVHLGRVVSVDPETVVLERKGLKKTLKISNIELLSEEEALRWKREHLGTKQMDFSYVFPEEVDEKALARVAKDLDSAVVSCDVVDVFRGRQIPEGKKSVTLRAELMEPEKAGLIEELLQRLGGVRR
ncbi:MAG: prephenate dehydrogenase [Methanobacteriota archaeon]|nr:MAG: prephenate dehydrogenase [Euryarchaeota archaeon]